MILLTNVARRFLCLCYVLREFLLIQYFLSLWFAESAELIRSISSLSDKVTISKRFAIQLLLFGQSFSIANLAAQRVPLPHCSASEPSALYMRKKNRIRVTQAAQQRVIDQICRCYDYSNFISETLNSAPGSAINQHGVITRLCI